MADIPFRWGRSSPLRTLAAGLLAIAAFLELLAWAKFPFGGYDSFSHIYWIAEWHRLWACGIPYPRWLPDSFHGFGAPSFYYYPPFPFFLSSLLYTVLPSFTAADIGKLLGLFAFLFSFFSMRSYLGWRANTMHAPMKSSIVTAAALLYTFGPYRIFNYATRGALPEHLAFGFVPLAFWGIDLLVQDKKRSGFLLLIVSLSFLILTNLPATAVAGIGMFLYVVFQQGQQRVNGLKGLFIAAVAAVLLTSFYLLPVGEMFGLVQMGRLWRVVPLVQSTPFLAIFTGEALTINSYSFIMLVGAMALFLAWLRSGNRSRPFFWILAVLIAAQLPVVTQYLYRFVPPFTIVQLASRFSILLLLVAALAWQDEFVKDRKHVPIVSWVVVFWSLCTIGLVSLQLADVHVHKHGPLPVGEAPEYATKWARQYEVWGDALAVPFKNDSQTVACEGATVMASKRTPYSDTIDLIATKPTTALLRRAYWPQWTAQIDGEATPVSPDTLGRIVTPVPTGEHRLTLKLDDATSAVLGDWISSISFVLIGLGSFFIPKSKNRPDHPRTIGAIYPRDPGSPQ